MSDFFSEDFFAPLDTDRPMKAIPTRPEMPAPARAPAQVLFEVQNELWSLIGDLEHEHVLKGRQREDFLQDLERTYAKLQRYLRGRMPNG